MQCCTTAIGGGSGNRNNNGNSGETSGDLVSSIENLGETTEETLGEPEGEGVIGKFGEMGNTIAEAENHVQGIIDKMDELDGMTAECSIVVNVETVGGVPAYADGTAINTDFESGEFTAEYGKAFAEGTGKYQGLPKAEKNALVSEYGQTEMTVLPNGDTIITDEPTLMDLPKDTVIYNEEQTKKIMDNKVDASGKAYADGTDDEGWWIGADGHRYRPLHEGDEGWDLMQKFQPLLNKMLNGEEYIMSNAIFEHQKQMEQLVRDINYNNVINNIANNNKPSVTFGDIYVTCPGVTEQQVAQYIPDAVKKELIKEFTGFSNYADQYSRIR